MELKDAGVFENAGQAVHVAFIVLGQEAQQDAPLRKALIKAMESIKLTNAQRNWLDELRGASSGSVNFAGMDGNEVRAQCAMITQAVKKLPAPEMWVLQAKYGQTDFEDADGTRRYAFSIERINAIKGLSDWFRPLFPSLQHLAVDCLLGRQFANHKKLDISVRDLSESFGGSHMKYQRAAKSMKVHVHDLEEIALGRLEGVFRRQGVVRVD